MYMCILYVRYYMHLLFSIICISLLLARPLTDLSVCLSVCVVHVVWCHRNFDGKYIVDRNGNVHLPGDDVEADILSFIPNIEF